MTNIAELLKDCPKGTRLYSPLFGEVEFAEVTDTAYMPIRVMKRGCGVRFDKYGRYMNAECLLFPSKDHRTWDGWKAPKPHYDISNFKAGMPVLVRDGDTKVWSFNWFSHYEDHSQYYSFVVCGDVSEQCIPYEGNEHLLGTTDMCDECYINW